VVTISPLTLVLRHSNVGYKGPVGTSTRMLGLWALVAAGCSSRAPVEETAPAPAAPAAHAAPPSLSVPDLPRKRPDGTHLSMVEIRDSLIPGAGKGLFAKFDIPAGTYIGFYDGTYLTEEEVDALDDLRSAYLFIIPECADEPVYTGIAGNLEHPISKVNFAPATINGQATNLQNVDFLERCEEPYEKLYTTRFVRAGEELYTDYGAEYPYDFMAFESVQAYFLEASGIPAADTFEWDYSDAAAGDDDSDP